MTKLIESQLAKVKEALNIVRPESRRNLKLTKINVPAKPERIVDNKDLGDSDQETLVDDNTRKKKKKHTERLLEGEVLSRACVVKELTSIELAEAKDTPKVGDCYQNEVEKNENKTINYCQRSAKNAPKNLEWHLKPAKDNDSKEQYESLSEARSIRETSTLGPCRRKETGLKKIRKDF
ncbi:12262_t:CDS:2, partial [Gigaspora rosea]